MRHVIWREPMRLHPQGLRKCVGRRVAASGGAGIQPLFPAVYWLNAASLNCAKRYARGTDMASQGPQLEASAGKSSTPGAEGTPMGEGACPYSVRPKNPSHYGPQSANADLGLNFERRVAAILALKLQLGLPAPCDEGHQAKPSQHQRIGFGLRHHRDKTVGTDGRKRTQCA